MFLKTLTMRGFKSFASATTLALEPGITCVVGPNGSGKSNVVDALAWVMGEQGAKNLRGGKMDDVIFAGTAKRQALGRAEVSLTIDNTDGAIPIDYTEVTISRTLFRTGGSEYAVNGLPARLLDIQELLNDSGLGKEMHVIVGQGRLDQILHADPQERRGFIEEAAGVLKHRRRKDKALRKLTGLQANLDRLLDLRQELARQLGPLGRQAKAAKRAAGVQATLRDTAARLLADDIVQAQARLESDPRTADRGERRAQLEARVAAADDAIAAAEAQLKGHEAEVEELGTALRAAGAQAARARALAQRAGDRVEFLRAQPLESTGKDSPEALAQRAERFAAEAQDAQAERAEREEALAALTADREAAQQELRAAEDALTRRRAQIAAQVRERAELESSRTVAQRALDDAGTTAAALDERATALEGDLARVRERLSAAQAAAAAQEEGETALDAAHESALAAADAAAAALADCDDARARHRAEADRLTARAEALELAARLAAATEDLLAAGVPGVRAPLGELVAIAPGYEVALAAVLGELAAAVVVDGMGAAAQLLGAVGADADIDLLVPAPAAGPESAPASEPAAPTPPAPPTAADALTGSEPIPARALLAADDPALGRLLDAQLADVFVCADLDTALSAALARPGATFAALGGEVVRPHRLTRAGAGEGARLAA
ncbi:AAA family ATPase, partial [Brevibacterium sp. 5221]